MEVHGSGAEPSLRGEAYSTAGASLRSRGKPHKVIRVACMQELMTAVYSVAKSGEPFVPILAPER